MTPSRLGVRANVLWYAVPRVATRGASFLLLPAYTRMLSTAEMGQVTVVLGLAGLVGLVIGPGLESIYLREALHADPLTRRVGFGTLVRIQLILLTLTTVVLVAGAPVIGTAVIPGVPVWPFYYVMVASAALGSLSIPLQSTWRAEHRADKLAAFGLAYAGVSVATTLVALFIFRWGAISVLLGNLVAEAVWLPLSVKKLWQGLRIGWESSAVERLLPVIAAGFPMTVYFWGITAIDRLLLNALAGPSEVGIYGVAYQIGAAVMMLTVIVNKEWQFLMFQFGRLESGGERDAQRLWSHSLCLFMAIAALIALVADEIVTIGLGPAYAAAAAIVPIVLAVAVLRVSYFLLVNLGIAVGAARTLAIDSIVALAAFVVANLVLIPQLGARGAAWAGVCASAVSCAYLYSRNWNVFGLDRPIALSSLTFVAVVVLAIVQPDTPGANLLAVALAGVVVYQTRAYWRFLGSFHTVDAEP